MESLKYVVFVYFISLASSAAVKENEKKPSSILNSQIVAGGKTQCEYYNARSQVPIDSTTFGHITCLEKEDQNYCQGFQTCDKNHACFAVWSNTDSNSTQHKSGRNVKRMGCLGEAISGHECSESDECLEDKEEEDVKGLFCCCHGHLCNAKFEWVPKPQTPLILTTKPPPTTSSGPENVLILMTSVAIIFIICILVFSLYCYKKKKNEQFEALPTSDRESGLNMGLSGGQFGHIILELPTEGIALNEIIGKGKSGIVRKGVLNGQEIAIKIFPMQSKQSWTLEKDIYSLPQMISHENILKFLGQSERRDNLSSLGSEYWLATEYHPKGSLYDYLKANLVSWENLCKIALSIGKGLEFLHEETPQRNAIAHRDFKSKNVLIKDDLTACISDFGLALVLEPGLGSNTNIQVAQVGTTRYMAPEVLECHISFEKNSFARVDMYACGLVLWELASRCTINHMQQNLDQTKISNPSPAVEEYKLPYEAEISNNPTIDQMLKLVVEDKVRPQLKTGSKSWRVRTGSNMDTLCDTIEDLWEHEEGCRIASATLVARIRSLQHRAHITDMQNQLNQIQLNTDSGVGSAASSNNGTSSSDLDAQGLDSRGQSTEMEPLMILDQNTNN